MRFPAKEHHRLAPPVGRLPDKIVQTARPVALEEYLEGNEVSFMAIADGTVAVDGRTIYTAEDLRVGLFTSTEGF